MPPVFRPWSPSFALLWSWALAMMRMVFPSTKDKTETSLPVMNSSTTTLSPEAPNFRSTMIWLMPATASSRVMQIRTPLPRAGPSAFRTTGILHVFTYSRAASGSVKVSYCAVGIWYFFISSLENALEPSMTAAFFRGPKTRSPFASNTSTMPPISGSSIPTMVRSIFFSSAKAASFSNSMAPMGTHSATSEMPALPGAQ